MLNHSNSSPHKRLNLIQVFRGLAAVMVLLGHGNLIYNQNFNQDFLFEVFLFGGLGVDFFFVLSGFIIFYVHQSDIGRRSRLKSFFTKRFIRIYPIYWVVLTLKLAASFLFAYDPETSQRSFGEILKAFLLFPQDRTILSSSFLGVSWTLSYEVFFYLMFGLLIGLKPKFSKPIIGGWLLITFMNFIGIIQIPQASLLLHFVFNELNLEFALGCLAAYILSRYTIKWGMNLIYIGASLSVLSAINSNSQLTGISPVIGFGIPAMVLVIGAVSLEMKKLIKVPNVLIYLGNASYSIYLMHGFAINNITKILLKLNPEISDNLLLLNILALPIAVIALIFGCAVYSYIEKPLLSTLKPKLATA